MTKIINTVHRRLDWYNVMKHIDHLRDWRVHHSPISKFLPQAFWNLPQLQSDYSQRIKLHVANYQNTDIYFIIYYPPHLTRNACSIKHGIAIICCPVSTHLSACSAKHGIAIVLHANCALNVESSSNAIICCPVSTHVRNIGFLWSHGVGWIRKWLYA